MLRPTGVSHKEMEECVKQKKQKKGGDDIMEQFANYNRMVEELAQYAHKVGHKELAFIADNIVRYGSTLFNTMSTQVHQSGGTSKAKDDTIFKLEGEKEDLEKKLYRAKQKAAQHKLGTKNLITPEEWHKCKFACYGCPMLLEYKANMEQHEPRCRYDPEYVHVPKRKSRAPATQSVAPQPSPQPLEPEQAQSQKEKSSSRSKSSKQRKDAAPATGAHSAVASTVLPTVVARSRDENQPPMVQSNVSSRSNQSQRSQQRSQQRKQKSKPYRDSRPSVMERVDNNLKSYSRKTTYGKK